MGVGIAGSQRNRPPVSGNRLIQPLQLVQHVAQVEKRQHVVGVDLGGAAVKLLGPVKLAQMEVNRSQVDPGRRKVRIELHHLLVKLDGAVLLARLLGLHRLQKHLLHARADSPPAGAAATARS